MNQYIVLAPIEEKKKQIAYCISGGCSRSECVYVYTPGHTANVSLLQSVAARPSARPIVCLYVIHSSFGLIWFLCVFQSNCVLLFIVDYFEVFRITLFQIDAIYSQISIDRIGRFCVARSETFHMYIIQFK